MGRKPSYEELERRIAELEQKSLSKQQYLLSKAQEIGHIGSWELDVIKKTLIWSDENYRIFGIPLGTELTCESFFNCVHPDDKAYFEKEWKASINKKSLDLEHRVIVADGVKWVREKAELQFNENGEFVRAIGFTHDISERKQDDHTIRARESFLNSIVHQSPFAIWISDAEGTLQIANPALKRFLNLTDEQLVGKYNILKDPLTERQGLMPLIRSVFEEGKTVSFTCEWDGHDIPTLNLHGSNSVSIEATMFPIYDPDGKLTNVVINWIDITDRQEAQKSLQINELRFRELFENLYDGVAIYQCENNGDDFKFVDINKAAQCLSKINRDDAIGKSLLELFPGIRELGLFEVLQRVYRTGNTEQLPMKRYQDKRISQWVDNTVFKLPSGEIVAVYRDDSERHIAENALRNSEQKFRALFESMNEGVCIHKLEDGGTDYKIVDVNPAYERQTGLTRDKAIGKMASDLYGTDTAPFIDIYRKVIDDKQSEIFEVYFDPMKKHFQISAFPMEEMTFATVFADITERKRIEDEIRGLNKQLEIRVAQRTSELEEANKELEDFVYSVSHDLRAPLRSVSGFAEIINRRHRVSLNEEGQHYIDNIIKASGQMGILIDDLLKFSRLGRKSIETARVSLDDVFAGALETLSDELEKVNALISIPKQMPIVKGDFTLVTHILINLLDNAIKYRKLNERLEIDIGFELDDGFVVVFVTDNGIGIAPEYHEKIFNIFQRLHTQEDYPGTGIGLAAVKKGMQILGGQVGVESELGKGSIFRIRIPA